jgi:predicted ATP-dependent serine protease
MKNVKFVCAECGHIEIRVLGLDCCPCCDSKFLIDDNAVEDEELDEAEVTDLVAQVMGAA